MLQPAFMATQYQFAGHIRNPETTVAPAGLEDRRMAIYRDLFYNNIEGFIASGFPVLRSILDDVCWHEMVRDFIKNHRCQTPYFLEISQEFVAYLQARQHQNVQFLWQPHFMVELCHYEWVELALDVADETIADNTGHSDLIKAKVAVSPLVWRLSYSFPVHKISRQFQPLHPVESGCFLVVYRNRDDSVQFLEVNQIVINLLQLIGESEVYSEKVLRELARNMKFADEQAFIQHGEPILKELYQLDILVTVA